MGRRLFKFDESGKLSEVQANADEVSAPNVITDEKPAFESHADGKMYTSMRKYEQSLKDLGYAVVQKQDFKPRQHDPVKDYEETREIVAKCLNDVKYGMAPLSEKEKERCLREQRDFESYKKRMR